MWPVKESWRWVTRCVECGEWMMSKVPAEKWDCPECGAVMVFHLFTNEMARREMTA